jgi:excisionase family DNA binding protein
MPSALELLGKSLGIRRSTIYQYAKEGKIPCVKIGNRWVVPEDAEQRIKELAYRNWPPEPEAKPPRRKRGQPVDEATSGTTMKPPAAGSDTPDAKGEDEPP